MAHRFSFVDGRVMLDDREVEEVRRFEIIGDPDEPLILRLEVFLSAVGGPADQDRRIATVQQPRAMRLREEHRHD